MFNDIIIHKRMPPSNFRLTYDTIQFYSFHYSKRWILSGLHLFLYSKSLRMSSYCLYLSTLFYTKNETNRVLSKRWILSGLHFSLNTLFDANNETKRVLFSTLKKVYIEWSSLISSTL